MSPCATNSRATLRVVSIRGFQFPGAILRGASLGQQVAPGFRALRISITVSLSLASTDEPAGGCWGEPVALTCFLALPGEPWRLRFGAIVSTVLGLVNRRTHRV